MPNTYNIYWDTYSGESYRLNYRPVAVAGDDYLKAESLVRVLEDAIAKRELHYLAGGDTIRIEENE